MESQHIETILSDIEQAVTEMYAQHTPSFLVYHNIDHTRAVVAHATEIAASYDISREDRFVLIAAVWFHDTGQMFAMPEWHEMESVKIANSFFAAHPSVPDNLTTAIDRCILATQMPQRPNFLVEEILCDADLYHLGTDAFTAIDNLVMEEYRLRGLSVDNWDKGTIMLLEKHQFHTAYCREQLTRKKERNLELLKAKLR